MDETYDLTNYETTTEFSYEEAVFTTITATSETFEITKELVNWTKVIFTILIFVIGLVGNSVIVFVIVVLHEYQKSVTNWYVLQLAIADSVFLLSLPFKASEDINNQWIYPEWLCKTKETVLFLNYFASILTLMIMSVDRYVAVCHNFSNRLQVLRKQRSSMIITAATWMISLCLCVPTICYVFPASSTIYDSNNVTAICLDEGNIGTELDWCIKFHKGLQAKVERNQHCRNYSWNENHFMSGSGSYEDYPESNSTGQGSGDYSGNTTYYNDEQPNDISSNSFAFDCVYENASSVWRSFLMFNFIVMFLLPILVMTVCYGLIIRRLTMSNKKSNNASNSSSGANHQSRTKKASTKTEKDRKRVTIMCATLVSCFVVFWLPFHVGHLAKLKGIPLPEKMGYICRNLNEAGSLMIYINSAINPYLYSVMGSNFTKRLLDASRTVKNIVSSRSQHSAYELNVRNSKRKKRNREGSSSNTGTVETKISKSRTANKHSMSDTKQSMDTSHVVCITDTQHAAASVVLNNDVVTSEPQADHNESSPLKE